MNRSVANERRKLHGNQGVYYGGDWLPIEECHNWICPNQLKNNVVNHSNTFKKMDKNIIYDVLIIGAGCIGASIARELSKYKLEILLVERDDDVSQGASKGNSGIIHAGYDDKPNTVKSKHCWKGNQMFSKLDKELKFGFNKNGSLVIAKSNQDYKHLNVLLHRGLKNGVKNLRIIEKDELHAMEPYLSPDCIAALYSPDAGVVSPFEYTISLCENAAQNGVNIATKHEVIDIKYIDKHSHFIVHIKKWLKLNNSDVRIDNKLRRIFIDNPNNSEYKTIKTKYIINCGGLFSDQISSMINDYSFTIKPRLGEYLLLNKTESYLANATLFPCPSVLGKGVLVQTTLWGNLMIGPTSRYFKDNKLSSDDIIKYLFQKSKELIPTIDPTKIINSFAGARPKSDRNDWIIEQTKVNNKITNKSINFFNVAGIDSPGLASSPSIAYYVIYKLLKESGLKLIKNNNFNPYRKPIIFPKNGWIGLKLKIFDNTDNSDNDELKTNVVCRCEKVTEYEIMDSMNRCGVVVNTTQSIRKRTRAGMGKCQGKYCEKYITQIIAKKYNLNVNDVGTRPFPATSILGHRWLNTNDRDYLRSLTQNKNAKL